jgi:hypothetical protein
MPRHLLALVALWSLSACAAPATILRDTMTIHNPEASRIWVIQKESDGRERIVLCESAWPGAGRPLCTFWPAP